MTTLRQDLKSLKSLRSDSVKIEQMIRIFKYFQKTFKIVRHGWHKDNPERMSYWKHKTISYDVESKCYTISYTTGEGTSRIFIPEDIIESQHWKAKIDKLKRNRWSPETIARSHQWYNLEIKK